MLDKNPKREMKQKLCIKANTLMRARNSFDLEKMLTVSIPNASHRKTKPLVQGFCHFFINPSVLNLCDAHSSNKCFLVA